MRDRNLALPVFALFAFTSAALAAPANANSGHGPYFGLKAGGIITEDAQADDVEIEYDTGFSISGQIGYQFDVFRLEGEFGFQGLEGLSDAGVNSDVDVGRFTLNGFIDLPITPTFGPYIGGGFGVATLQAEDDFIDDDSAFTWHGEAGLNFNANRQFVISPFYRYQVIDTDLGGQTDPLESHVVGVSLRYVLTWLGGPRHGGSYGGPGYGAY